MAPQLLQINPQKEIIFSGRNFDQTSHTEILTLQNVATSTNVAFKVKTTALKSYLVRPSSQVLQPGEKINVQIMLQRLSEVPANYQHRFLVQALPTQETSIESKESWQELAKQHSIQEFRLSVVFPDVNGRDGKSGGSGDDTKDLKTKYDEIVKYTERLTEQRKLFVEEIENLKKQNAAGGGKKVGGYQLWHIILTVIVTLVIMKVLEKAQLSPLGNQEL